MERGKIESSVIGMPPGRQIWPPWVWPLSRRLKSAWAACRYTSGVCEIRIENSSWGIAAVAFSMYPVTIEELMAISDAKEIMPPKSTWFEPKLRDGLLSHLI